MLKSLLICVAFTKSFSYRLQFISSKYSLRMSSFNAYENSERASELTNNLISVNNRIENAISSSGRDSKSVTLIAVSKTKPSSDLLEIYNTGHV